ncbi:MAG TPA: FAD-binding oxidoreductase [Solirubrobacterales bacterium]|jgi:alkyldihydroxyacetonephosphate synthase
MSAAEAGGAMKWWGWGDPGVRVPLPESALAVLRDELGPGEPSPRVELEEVAVPEPRPLPEAVTAAAGEPGPLAAHEQRVRRAAGKGYPDLIRMRAGRPEGAPDAVLLPSSAEQVAAIIRACAETGVAVVPFGGGTSVVGGVAPEAGPHERVIALDLRRLRRCEVDRRSLTATLGAGLRGPEAEAALAQHGLTLGHFPQSFEFATIGGFAATRSAGQASCGYGRFDELVTALELVTPVGPLRTLTTPHTAAGPSLREVALGSEGTLGVLTDVTVRVRPAPEARRYEGWIARDFETGCEAVRALAQADALPDVTRVSDEEETRVNLMLAGDGTALKVLGAYLRLRRVADGAMLILGWEGEREAVERRRAIAARVLRAHGVVSLGSAPGRAWEHGRFRGPYLRDELLDHGYLVETLETAHSWSKYQALYRAVRDALTSALRDGGTPPIVFCHLSHAYRDGASLYFTFLARARPGAELEQWAAAKRAASEAIMTAGGTITHHHAVGRDHAPYMDAEVGWVGLEALRALKQRLDPAGVMNPGKLLPA